MLFAALKTERPVLDRPLKVGGGIQPQLVTVLTPATTFTVGLNCNQNRRAVKRRVQNNLFGPFFLLAKPQAIIGRAQECVNQVIDSILIRRIAIVVELAKPKLKSGVRIGHRTPQVDLVAPVNELRIVSELRPSVCEKRRKCRNKESARHVDALLVSTCVIVVDSSGASSGDVTRPEIQAVRVRILLIRKKILVLLENEEALLSIGFVVVGIEP